MRLAKDYRNEIRNELLQGNIPINVEQSILIYEQLREDDCWRSTLLLECIGEVALIWFEQNKKVEVPKPTHIQLKLW